MIKKLRKAFTIIELVIVIAVIAILAAVLIPTFSSLVDKANESVDMQLVKQMNTILEAEEITDDKPSTVIDVKKVLEDNGINQFKPIDSNNVFYWVSTKNIVLLYNNVKNKVIYPKEYTKEEKLETVWFDLNFSDEEVDIKSVITPNEGETITQALINVIAACDAIKDIYLTLPKNSEIVIDDTNFNLFFDSMSYNNQGKRIHINLNGNNLNIIKPGSQGYVNTNGGLELLNGNILYEGKEKDAYDCLFTVKDGASLVLDNINLSAKNAYAVLFPSATASEVVINNTTIVADAYFVLSTNGVSSNKVRIQIENSKLQGEGTCVLVNVPSVTYILNSTLIGCEHALFVRSGDVNVSDTKISVTCEEPEIFSYDDFANTYKDSYKGYWGQGNTAPAAGIVAGDYSKSNSSGEYPYAGNVSIELNNCSIETTDSNKIPNVLIASSNPNKKVFINYDDDCSLGNIIVYGTNWKQNDYQINCHSNTLFVNGKEAKLTSDKKTIIE